MKVLYWTRAKMVKDTFEVGCPMRNSSAAARRSSIGHDGAMMGRRGIYAEGNYRPRVDVLVSHREGWMDSRVRVGDQIDCPLTPATPRVVWAPTSDKQGHLAACPGGAVSFLPTRQRRTLMGRSERGLRDQLVTVSIQRQPKTR